MDWAAAEVRQLLAKSPLFAKLDATDLERVAALGRRRRVAAEEVIVRHGEPAEHVYAILRGRVRAVSQSEDGKEVVLRIQQAGETFGELGLLHGGKRTATVIASEPCELLAIGRRDFLSLVEQNSRIAVFLLAALSERITELTEQLADFALRSLPVRLAKRLLDLAEIYGRRVPEGLRIEARISQQDLASWVGTTREAVNKHLRQWEAEGVIRLERVTLTILRQSTLQALAGEKTAC